MPASAAAVLMRDRLRRRGPALPGRMRWERGLARRGCRARLVRRGGRARLGPVTVDVHADPPARHDRAEALHGGRVRQQHMVHAVPGDRLRAGAARGGTPDPRPTACTLPAGPPSPAACARNARCAARTPMWPFHCYERSSHVLETLHDFVQLAWWAHVATLHAPRRLDARSAAAPPGGGPHPILKAGRVLAVGVAQEAERPRLCMAPQARVSAPLGSSLMAGDCLFPSWSIQCIAAMAGAVPALHPGSAEAAPRTVEGGPVRDALP